MQNAVVSESSVLSTIFKMNGKRRIKNIKKTHNSYFLNPVQQFIECLILIVGKEKLSFSLVKLLCVWLIFIKVVMEPRILKLGSNCFQILVRTHNDESASNHSYTKSGQNFKFPLKCFENRKSYASSIFYVYSGGNSVGVE